MSRSMSEFKHTAISKNLTGQSIRTSRVPADYVPADRMAEFVELYSRYYPRLQYYLMALLPSANDASDVLQESSLVLWEKFGTYESGTNFYAWACKIARLQALKFRNRMGRTAMVLDDA